MEDNVLMIFLSALRNCGSSGGGGDGLTCPIDSPAPPPAPINPDPVTVTTSIDSRGLVCPQGGPFVVDQGTQISFKVISEEGFLVKSEVTGGPGGTWNGDVYTTAPITEDCTIAFSTIYEELANLPPSLSIPDADPLSAAFPLPAPTFPSPPTPPDPWQRPADWVAKPTFSAGEQKIVMLYAVYNSLANYFSFIVNGAFTVDWGDGSAVENFASGATANHFFDYTNPALDGTLTTDGFKQAQIIVTPQAGNNLTLFNLNVKGLSTFADTHSTNLVELTISAPFLTSTTISLGSTLPTTRQNLLRSVSFLALGTITLTYRLASLRSLEHVYIAPTISSITDLSYICQYCGRLKRVDWGDCNFAAVTTSTYMFRNCLNLSYVSLPTFFGNTTSYAFSGSGLKYLEATSYQIGTGTLTQTFNNVHYVKIHSISGTSYNTVFQNHSSLRQIEILDASALTGTTLQSAFSGCTNLIYAKLAIPPNTTTIEGMFTSCAALLGFEFIYHTEVKKLTRIANIFSGCTKLIEVDLSKFKLDPVNPIHLNSAFLNCNSLSIIRNKFDTVNALFDSTSLVSLFSGCESLTSVDSSIFDNFNFNNFTPYALNALFLGCVSLQKLTGDWSVFKPISATHFFNNCKSLVSVNDLFSVDLSTCTSLSNAFYGCTSLKFVSFENSNVSNITDISNMFQTSGIEVFKTTPKWGEMPLTTILSLFQGCTNLFSVDLSHFNRNSITVTRHLFNGCTSLIEFVAPASWANLRPASVESMFANCTKLHRVDLSNFYTASSTSFASLFSGCSTLREIILGGQFQTTNATTLGSMFSGCATLLEIDVSAFDVSNITTAASMFYGCNLLEKVNISNWNPSNNFSFANMFELCSSLDSLISTNINTSKCTNMTYMFAGCGGLKEINVNHWSIAACTSFSYMFTLCNKLQKFIAPNWNITLNASITYMFNGCTSLAEVDFGINSALTSLAYIFHDCFSLKKISFNKWTLPAVTLLGNAFDSCYALEEINCLGLSNQAVTSLSNTFVSCTSLKKINLPNLRTTTSCTMTSTFSSCQNLEEINLRFQNTFSVASCKLSGAALNNIYQNWLGTGLTSKTITVTGNWGIATDNPALVPTGWTVTGS